MNKWTIGWINEWMSKMKGRVKGEDEWMNVFYMCMRKEWIKECSKQIIDWKISSLYAICVWVKIEWIKECS